MLNISSDLEKNADSLQFGSSRVQSGASFAIQGIRIVLFLYFLLGIKEFMIFLILFGVVSIDVRKTETANVGLVRLVWCILVIKWMNRRKENESISKILYKKCVSSQLVLLIPFLSTFFILQLTNRDRLSKDDAIGTVHLPLSQISGQGGDGNLWSTFVFTHNH